MKISPSVLECLWGSFIVVSYLYQRANTVKRTSENEDFEHFGCVGQCIKPH
jgi:hypothetical protein